MEIKGWEERYRSQPPAQTTGPFVPTKLVRTIAETMSAGEALDLACGSGRNALWLAAAGWRVTAIDGSEAAIRIVQERARFNGLTVIAQVADLQDAAWSLDGRQWDLVTICYYLQRDLFDRAKRWVRPGGTLVSIVHITEGEEEPTGSRLRPGELPTFFVGWQMLHQYEGKPDDPEHRRLVAEVVVRRPG